LEDRAFPSEGLDVKAGVLRVAVGAVVWGLVVAAATATAQPDDAREVVLPAKLDVEGLSQMLIPIKIDGHTFWCNADSGGSRVLSLLLPELAVEFDYLTPSVRERGAQGISRPRASASDSTVNGFSNRPNSPSVIPLTDST
jgi:hypothetical protein